MFATKSDRSRSFVLFVILAALIAVAVGCTGPAPQRHAELEWQMRHEMPGWGPVEWNAWEAELAAALDKPEPDPPMFPEADASDDEADAGDE